MWKEESDVALFLSTHEKLYAMHMLPYLPLSKLYTNPNLIYINHHSNLNNLLHVHKHNIGEH